MEHPYEMSDPTVDRTKMLSRIGELTLLNETLAAHLEAKVLEVAQLTEENEALRALKEEDTGEVHAG